MSQPLDQRIDLVRALKLRAKGMTYEEIGQLMGVTKQAIHQRLGSLSAVLDDPDKLKAFQEHEADILDSVRMQALGYMVDPETLKKASFNNLGYGIMQLFQMGRLLRGQSSSNVAMLSGIIQAADAHTPDTHVVSDTLQVVDVVDNYDVDTK